MPRQGVSGDLCHTVVRLTENEAGGAVAPPVRVRLRTPYRSRPISCSSCAFAFR
jgi:hypothetical protein